MKLSKPTIQELGEIVHQEFGKELSKDDLEKLAYSLIGYFALSLKAETRDRNKREFGNSSASRIDNEIQRKENNKY